MRKAPNLYTLDTLYEWLNSGPDVQIGNRWYPARPLGYFSLWHRLKLAWLVFSGKCDALKWHGDQ